MQADITVAMPVIPPRINGPLFQAAVASIHSQELQPAGGISCALDVGHYGAAITRQRALDGVRTKWTAFLDDDDVMYPQHLRVLYGLVEDQKADLAYAWFDGNNPFPMHRGRKWNPEEPHHTTMTVLVRTDLAKEAGFLLPGNQPLHQDWMGEDWQFILRCSALSDGNFVGTDEITWHYRVHGANTSGLPGRW